MGGRTYHENVRHDLESRIVTFAHSCFLRARASPRIEDTKSFVCRDNVRKLAGPQSLMVLHTGDDYYTIVKYWQGPEGGL